MPSDSIAEVADSIKDEDTNLSSTPSGAPINTLIDTPSELCDQATASSNLKQAVVVLDTLMDCVKQQVLGRDNVIELAIIALIADGHVLLEDFPGSGKTTLAKALGEAIVSENTNSDEFILPFRRIQFTPDLLPSDVTGVPVFDSNSNAFHFRHGPIFAHVVLADEINRTSPKVQSAMLEAMGENGTGTRDVLGAGYLPKRALLELMHAFRYGIAA